MNNTMKYPNDEHQMIMVLRGQRRKRFIARGVSFAIASGICYGLYTALLTFAQSQGVWRQWFSDLTWNGNPPLQAFAVTFTVAALASGLNDFFSGLWSLVICLKNGQIGDLWKTVKSKPGRMMMLCGVVGGPVATIAYVVALNSAVRMGNPGVIVPIAALNCAIGAFLGCVLFKQRLKAHAMIGIAVCLVAAGTIGGASFTDLGANALLSCAFAFIAAFGWGFEGCIAGFGTILIDYRIGIAIRQATVGILELLIIFPLLAAVGGDLSLVPAMFVSTVQSPSIFVFVVAGLFAMPAFSFWYKGNSMCGTALGMACNGMYAFWGPLFIWIIMGLLDLGDQAAQYPPLTPVQWVGATVMVIGIFLIAVDPGGVVKRSEEKNDR